ncbi:MAG: hypothetical protein K2Y23_12710 [Cyanobacteria bacterium]|nr:hypothetical protein [Cyanobacteriota bacterium]
MKAHGVTTASSGSCIMFSRTREAYDFEPAAKTVAKKKAKRKTKKG